ncbi:MAG: acyl-CoA dehydrogenase family protein [Actinomycetota bacterium]|nr:acyl-CoA dehydrogenase family protein [Actinomycetota bacterium]
MSELYRLLPEQEEFRKVVREFSLDKVAPRAAEIDAEGEYPHDIHLEMVKADLLSVMFPEEVGGAGADSITQAILIEEITRLCTNSGMIPLLNKLGMTPLLLRGSDEQQRAWIPQIISGEAQAAYALTEPEAGSDVANLRTRAQRDGDGWLINGGKRFISNAGVATVYTLFAKTDPGAGHEGISCFIVPADAAGFRVTKFEEKMGLRGSPTGELVLDDVRVPADHLVGEEGEGFPIAMMTLDRSRPGIGAQALGIAQGAFDVALAYARQRTQFGRPIIDNQAVSFMLADMDMKIRAARHLVYEAHAMIDRQDPELRYLAAAAKCFASDVAMAVTTDAVQVLGGYGYIREFPAERFMRDAKITQIYEGTNQIQRVVMGRRLAGES